MITVLTNVSTHRMESLCGRKSEIKVVPHAKVNEIPLNEIQVWCVKNGVYQVVTQELVFHLHTFIAGRSAIEICAGNGVLGRALGIPRTDSHVQLEYRARFEALGQQIIIPPKDVEKLEAMEAVRKYNPQVVIASFATQRWEPGLDDGFEKGVEEAEILKHPSVEAYVVVGNKGVHGKKKIFVALTSSESFPWLVSRCADQTQNRIFTWDKTIKTKRHR